MEEERVEVTLIIKEAFITGHDTLASGESSC
jgi:hypothetical protein